MLVARSFSPPSTSYMNEKNEVRRVTQRQVSQRSRSPLRGANGSTHKITSQSTSTTSRTEPVQIPSRNANKQKQLQQQNKQSLPKQTIEPPIRSVSTAVQPPSNLHAEVQAFRTKRESAKDILSATTIPTRRRQARTAQRLPQGNHVAEFSKFLLDDVPAGKDVTFPRNQSLSQIEGLFGHIDELMEGQLIVASESLEDSALSARSISSDSLASMASMASPDDFGSSHLDARSPSVGRSPQGRIVLLTRATQDCSRDHPLANLDEIESISLKSSDSPTTPPGSPSMATTSPQTRTSRKEAPRSSFKSTLSSSLKALRSAARTTLMSSSGFGHHGGMGSSNLYSNESLLAHNFFDIQPSLTDDRRPPPTMTKPSPELRRYLNPQMASAPADSPAQLHFWQDERHIYNAKKEKELIKQKIREKRRRKHSPGPKSKIDALPSIVPLSTCLPPTVRTANASSPPIWLTPDGEPINKSMALSLLHDPDASASNNTPKTREPRENSDFLRMYVCEMAMRKNGKLSDDTASGRAKLWLPPMSGPQPNAIHRPLRSAAERWKGISVDEVSK